MVPYGCLSMSIVGLALSWDRLMSIGQAITMPLFFSSSAVPGEDHAGLLQVISHCNPLFYEVDALCGLLSGTPAHLGPGFIVLTVATVAGVAASAALPPQLAR